MVTNIIGLNIQHSIESAMDDEMTEGGKKKGGKGGLTTTRKSRKATTINKASMRNELTVVIIIDIEALC